MSTYEQNTRDHFLPYSLVICDGWGCSRRGECPHGKPHRETDGCNPYQPCEMVCGGPRCVVRFGGAEPFPDVSLRDALVSLLKLHRHRHPAVEADFMLRCLEAHNLAEEDSDV